MSLCKICLRSTPGAQKYTGYHNGCLTKLLGGANVSPQLSFDKTKFVTELAQNFSKGMSISGVQKKLSMAVVGNEIVPIEIGGRYILKPSVVEFAELSENEHLSMIIGERLGIDTPPCGLVEFSDGELAYIIKRFDWVGKAKLQKEDLAQIFNLHRDEDGTFKYDKSYEEVSEKLKEITGNKLVVVLRFFERLVYNYLIHNGDYHLKNISVQSVTPTSSGIFESLTPNYDSVMTRLYYPREGDMALDLLKNGEHTNSFEALGYYTRADFDELALRIGLTTQAVGLFYSKIIAKKSEILALIKSSFLSKPRSQEYEAHFSEYFGRLFPNG